MTVIVCNKPCDNKDEQGECGLALIELTNANYPGDATGLCICEWFKI